MVSSLRIGWTLAVGLGTASLLHAQDPCASYPGLPGATEIPNAGLEMPVPNTGSNWLHVHGSAAHKNSRDENALDLNLNSPSFDFDNGLPALAAASGIVTFAGRTSCSYGYSVVVEHNNGSETFSTQYAHLNPDLMVAAGQRVRKGQVLGYISGTPSYPNHLHFGLIQGNTAKYANVNGQSTEHADTQDLALASDTKLFWIEDFSAAPAWEWVDGTSPLVISGHLGILPPGLVVRHEQPVFALPEDRPYRLSFASMSFRLRRQVPTGWLRLDCLADQQPPDQAILDTIWLTPESESLGGWALRSFRIGDGGHPCPAGTRFVRPVLEARGDSGTAMIIDWVALEEYPLVTGGGMVRFNSYVRGAVRHHAWSVDDPDAFSVAYVLAATTRGGGGLQVACSATVEERNGSCTSESLDPRYFWLALVSKGGIPWVLGPIGPVEPYQWALVPGLGTTAIVTAMRNIPPWADYPYQSFDGDTDTYGLINYAPSLEWVFFSPAVPVSGLTTFEAHYGGTHTQAYVFAQDYATKQWVYVGQATNTPLQWSVLSAPGVWPEVTGNVVVYFDRLDLDQFLHVAEVRFH